MLNESSTVEEGKTQREIAEELGVDQKTISRDLGKNTVITEKMPKEPRKVVGYRITQYTKPETAARRIREVFGDWYVGKVPTHLPPTPQLPENIRTDFIGAPP
jgi:hypothetical protein